MKKIILGLVGVMILSGCLQTKSEYNSQLIMDTDQQAILKSHCDSMNQTGDMIQLLTQIKKDTNYVLDLLQKSDPRKYQKKITTLADRVSENSQKVIHLSKPEWTTNQWNHQVQWKINDEDFDDILGVNLGSFQILDYRLERVYFQGQLRDDLKEKITLHEGSDQIDISYQNMGSSLEVCQLEKTMMIVMKVKYRSLLITDDRFFNLHIN